MVEHKLTDLKHAKSRSLLEMRLIDLALEFDDITPDEASLMTKIAWITAPDIRQTMVIEAEKKKRAG